METKSQTQLHDWTECLFFDLTGRPLVKVTLKERAIRLNGRPFLFSFWLQKAQEPALSLLDTRWLYLFLFLYWRSKICWKIVNKYFVRIEPFLDTTLKVAALVSSKSIENLTRCLQAYFCHLIFTWKTILKDSKPLYSLQYQKQAHKERWCN